jgi:hypothetical protein
LDAIIGVDSVRDSPKSVFKELPRSLAIGLFDKLSDRVLSGPINACEEIELDERIPKYFLPFQRKDQTVKSNTYLEKY